jgi:nitroreductase
MELEDAMRTAGTCRYYKPDPVPDEVLRPLFDAARFGPSGGNRQPVRFIIVRDREKKRQMKDWHLQPWRAYRARVEQGGLRIEGADRLLRDGDHYAEHLDEVPVWVLVCAIMRDIRPTDTALPRFGVVGGASIFPQVQNLLLKCREAGLGAALTTSLCAFEPQVRELLEIPEGVLVAGLVTIGYPARPLPTRLSRRPVGQLVFSERYGDPLCSQP